MKKSKYEKNNFPIPLLRGWDKAKKRIIGEEDGNGNSRNNLFCAAVLACVKVVLDPPDRPKDPEEDREQLEYLREWKEKHKK